MFGYNRHTRTLLDSVKEMISHNFLPGHIIGVKLTDVLTIIDPMDNKILYMKGVMAVKDYHRQSLENICLIYTYLKLKNNIPTSLIKEYLNSVEFMESSGNNDTIINYKQVLTRINMDYAQTFNYTPNEIKTSAYLKSVLMSDNSMLQDYMNSVYSFSYYYITEDRYTSGGYKGVTHLSFMYYNTICEAYYKKDMYEKPVLFINKYYETTIKQLYNIALRLTAQITEKEYERTFNLDRLPVIKYKDLLIDNDFIKKYDVYMIIVVYENNKKPVKLKDVNPEQNVLPIFITKKELKKTIGKKYKSKEIYPDIDEKQLAVKMGKRKIYTLPFWTMEQYMNMNYKKRNDKMDYIDGIYFGDFLKNSLIQVYLKNKMTFYNNTLKINLNYEQRIEYLKENIIKNKIYDIINSDIIKSKDDKYFDATPTINKEYEKRYDINENIYLEPSIQNDNKMDEEDLMNVYIPNEKIEIFEEKNIENYLEKMTDNLDLNFDLIDIDDDTLVNDDFYDESMSIIEEEKPKSSYLTEEELMILPFDMSKDFFLF